MSTPFEPSSIPLESPRPVATVVETPALTSAFLPILIVVLTLLVWFGFQVSQLRAERDAMRDAISKQDKPVADSKKLRDTLDSLARGTAQLADGGNANARLIVDELKRRGVTINANQTPATPAAPTP